MKRIQMLVLAIGLMAGALGGAQAGVLQDGTKSFKVVMDDIYKEMGSPPMTEEVAEKMDRALFMRDFDKQPALSTKVAISWGSYKDSMTAMISVEVNGRLERERVIWRPGRPLEQIDPDAVLEW